MDIINWKEHSHAYKFVLFAFFAFFVALFAHWASTVGLFGHGLTDINVQDQFGDVCHFNHGPEDFAGVEDLTLISDHAFYFAHPYRRTFANKEHLDVFIRDLGLQDRHIDSLRDLIPYLPAEYRRPRIFTTDLINTGFPAVGIEEVEVEGFDLKKYFEFFPMGVDSYTSADGKDYINAIFLNRIGHHVAQFEVVKMTQNVAQNEENKIQNDNEKVRITDDKKVRTEPKPQTVEQTVGKTPQNSQSSKFSPNKISNNKVSTQVKLVLKNVWSSSTWGTPNGLAIINENEFYITNFLTTLPLDSELSSLLELLLLRRRGGILHCATSTDLLPTHPIGYDSQGENLVPSNLTPEIIKTTTPFHGTNDKPLYCYQFVSHLGQANGIAVDLDRKQLIITTGLAKSLVSIELGTHDILQYIPVPIGVDNLKIDRDSHDLFYGLNPSMMAIGKIIEDVNERAPSAVYRLAARSVEYTEAELERRRKLAEKNSDSGDLVTIEGLSEGDEILDDPKNTKKVFYYFEPKPEDIYVDTKPLYKSTAPTALPIPMKYTNEKVKNMPNYRLFITGSVYDQGIDVCRVIV
jgi:hypothetical protein